MNSVLAVSSVLLTAYCLCASSTAADKPGKLSIYAQSWESPHDFEPRGLTERERELIREILAAGADFQALYVPDVVTGNIDALDQVGAKFGQFYVICGSPEVSRSVRPLCDELGLPLGLSLSTKEGTGGDQISAWQGCLHIRRLVLMHPHILQDDLLGLGEYPALESLQLGSGGLRSPDLKLPGRGPTYFYKVAGLTTSLVDTLAETETLQRLMLFGCPVTATNLDRLQNLKTLAMRNCELSPETLASAGRLPQIERLDLNGSVVTDASSFDLSALRHVRTVDLPHLSGRLKRTLQQVAGLDQLPDLEALSFSSLRGEAWPDLSVIPKQVQRVEFYDVVLDDLYDLGFAGARLQAHRVLFERLVDSGRFALTEMHDSREANRRGCRIAGRQVETVRLRGEEFEPTDFRIVRFPHWTVETGFADDATAPVPYNPDFTPLQRQAAQRLARLDLSISQEPMGGGFIIGELADVYLRWEQPLALPSDAADAVDQLVQIPLEKLVVRTDEFPLERLAELGQIKTLTSFELRRDGLTDEHLNILQTWNDLKELTIHSPGSRFSKEGLEQLADSLPKCDLEITDSSGRQPLLWRKKPPAGLQRLPPITF